MTSGTLAVLTKGVVPIHPIRRVCSHTKEDFDCYLGEWEARRWWPKVPGVEKLEIVLVPSGINLDGDEEDDSETITIDVGRGPLDHHGTDAPSSAFLVAKALGREKDPGLQFLLQRLADVEVGREVPPDSIHYRISALARRYRTVDEQGKSVTDIERVREEIFLMIEDIYHQESDRARSRAELRTLEESQRWRFPILLNGLRIANLTGWFAHLMGAAFKLGYDVVIWSQYPDRKDQTAGFYAGVQTSKKIQLSLTAVADRLDREECRARGIQGLGLGEIEPWYWDPRGFVLRGSASNPIEPEQRTRLEVRAFVQVVLQELVRLPVVRLEDQAEGEAR